jgi:formylglycine-generating enzyme required for sulfatase activity
MLFFERKNIKMMKSEKKRNPLGRTCCRAVICLICILIPLGGDIQSVHAETDDKKMSVAVVEFDVMGDLGIKDAGAIIAEWMISSIGKTGKFDLKERVLLKKVLEEQELVLSGIVVDNKVVNKIGKLYGVQGVITGGVLRWGQTISVTARLIDTSNGTILKACDVKTSNIDAIPNKIDDLALILAGLEHPSHEEHVSSDMHGVAPSIETGPAIKDDLDGRKTADPSSGTYREPVTGMEFVLIEGGCFMMGQQKVESIDITEEMGQRQYKRYYDDEKPAHKVCVKGLWIAKHEVTNRQFRLYQDGHISKHYKGYSLNGDEQPAVYVSWNQAQAFAQWLAVQNVTGKTFRLPTEAEWEYVCRAGTESARFWGDDSDEACRYGNVYDRTAKRGDTVSVVNHDCDDDFVVTAPVGSFDPNPYGIYDMLGNVWEWVEDDYHKEGYKAHSFEDPLYKSGNPDANKARRGGAWSDAPASVRCANRGNRSPNRKNNKIGFRLVMEQ